MITGHNWVIRWKGIDLEQANRMWITWIEKDINLVWKQALLALYRPE